MEDGEVKEEDGRRIDGKMRDVTQEVYIFRCDDPQQEKDEMAGEEMEGEQVVADVAKG